jgi:hypothetical protein
MQHSLMSEASTHVILISSDMHCVDGMIYVYKIFNHFSLAKYML